MKIAHHLGRWEFIPNRELICKKTFMPPCHGEWWNKSVDSGAE